MDLDACSRCRKRNGPFAMCVTFVDRQGRPLFSGACSSCQDTDELRLIHATLLTSGGENSSRNICGLVRPRPKEPSTEC